MRTIRSGCRFFARMGVLALGLAIVAGPAGAGSPAAAANDAETYRQLDRLMDVFERVRAEYVDKVDDEKLVEGAINGMLAALDPHSSYLDERDFDTMKTQTDGEYGGLGIEVTMQDGVVRVVSPIDDTCGAGRPQGRGFHHPPQQGTGVRPDAVGSHRQDEEGPAQDADHPDRGARGGRPALRCHAGARDHHAQAGQIRSQGRGRLCPHLLVQPPDRARREDRGRYPAQADRTQAGRLCHRPAPQSGRSARPGGGCVRFLPRSWRNRLAARSPQGRHAALLRPPGRYRRRQADRHSRRRTVRLGGGNRRARRWRTIAARWSWASAHSARDRCRR